MRILKIQCAISNNQKGDRFILVNKSVPFFLKSIEQLANLQARLAVKQWQAHSSAADDATDGSRPLDLINDSISMLDQLLQFGETSERLSIVASAYKRMAWVSSKNTHTKALGKMEDYYKKASEASPDDTYPLFNYLTAHTIVNWDKNKTDEVMQAKIQDLDVSIISNQQQTNFWKLAEYADFQLLKHLSQESLIENKSEIISSYINAKKRAGSPREFSSVTEHLEFLSLMAESQILAGKRKNKIVGALREILKMLTS